MDFFHCRNRVREKDKKINIYICRGRFKDDVDTWI
uniref:Uncharacterized protein n=1 Tax=Anguilla anguilla TaxID=7936 RepID=A0A0E9PJA8_ANGAN